MNVQTVFRYCIMKQTFICMLWPLLALENVKSFFVIKKVSCTQNLSPWVTNAFPCMAITFKLLKIPSMSCDMHAHHLTFRCHIRLFAPLNHMSAWHSQLFIDQFPIRVSAWYQSRLFFSTIESSFIIFKTISVGNSEQFHFSCLDTVLTCCQPLIPG